MSARRSISSSLWCYSYDPDSATVTRHVAWKIMRVAGAATVCIDDRDACCRFGLAANDFPNDDGSSRRQQHPRCRFRSMPTNQPQNLALREQPLNDALPWMLANGFSLLARLSTETPRIGSPNPRRRLRDRSDSVVSGSSPAVCIIFFIPIGFLLLLLVRLEVPQAERHSGRKPGVT